VITAQNCVTWKLDDNFNFPVKMVLGIEDLNLEDIVDSFDIAVHDKGGKEEGFML
jgi:hypothetical protein